MLTPLQEQMIEQAKIANGNDICPCGNAKTWENSFLVYPDEVQLWYNTKDGSTHLMNDKLFFGLVKRTRRIAEVLI